MIDKLNKQIEQLPIIRDLASQLLSLAKDIVSSRRGTYDRNDFLGAMALLLWSAHGPPRENRPRRWFLYEFKESYCKMMKGEYSDVVLDPKTEAAIRQDIQEYADLLLTKAAKEKLHQGKALSINPDPFIIKHLPPIKNIFDELKGKGEIDQKAYPLYQILSQWPHGTPQGMGMVFRHDGNFFSHDEATDKYLGGCAIMTGLQSLNITAILFNDHFKLNFQDRLEESRKRYFEL